MNGLGRASVERFRDGVERLLARAFRHEDRLALAVSGGPDSMAMLALATAAFPGQVGAATIDHGLRPESADEAAMVARYAATIGVPHLVLRIEAPPEPGDNVQAWARTQRYALLSQWAVEAGATFLATAHHADDQAETFLMRAARGSGVAGLAGIRALQYRDGSHPVDLLRPLLDWRASELRALVTSVGVPFVDDPSNIDVLYDRTHFRALLKGAPWLDPAQIARSATHVAQADATIREIEAWLWTSRKRAPVGVDNPDNQTWLDIADLPRELQRRMCRSAIQSVRDANAIVSPDFSDSTNIEPLLDALNAGKSATQGGIMVSVKHLVWRFTLAPPRRSL